VHLKKLNILGFKSFSNKTTIRFSNGLTAIVGPNGCGKTNVLDALRWVLGEQKPTLLRGGKMEEIIFNGTHDVKPLGMAEVTLSIVNDRGVLPTEYNEVQITRRLFRSGESEYLLNKVPCRLKDIADLFVDTGMGAHSYSVIQQDMIDSVISDKAEERRFLFEEAAGVTKYKQRRKAATRKLEATEQDFLRLKDIYAEVKTRVNSLYRQHKKAERYQKVVDEIRGWDLYVGATRTKEYQDERRELNSRLDSHTQQKQERDTTLDIKSVQLEQHRSELLNLERELSQIAADAHEITEAAHAVEREISVLGEKKSNAEQLIVKNEADIEQLEERSRSLTGQTEQTRTELAAQQTELDNISRELEQAESAQAESDRHLLEARTSREDRNKRLLELEGKLSSGRTEEQNLKEQDAELSGQIGEIESQLASNEPAQTELLNKRQSQQEHLDELARRKNDTELKRTQLSEEVERLVDRSEEISLETSNIQASIEAAEARRNLLEEMMLHYEGHDAGVVATMEERHRWPDVAGTVAEKFVPVEGMETAVEAALGEMAQFIICYNRRSAEQIVEFLRTEKKGRIGILVPDTGTIAAGAKRPDLDSRPEVVGWLDGYVSTDENLKQLKDAILARTIVFTAGSDPSGLLEALPYGFTAVSTEGLVYRKNVIAGGSGDQFPLFRRKERVEEQNHLLTELKEKLEEAATEKNRTVARIGEARATLNELATELENVAEETESSQKSHSETEFEYRSLATEFDRLNRERRTLMTKLETIRDRQYRLGLDSSELAGQKNSLVSGMAEAGGRLEDLEREAGAAVDRVSKLQVATIEARSKVQRTESQINHVNELIQEITRTIATKREEVESARNDIAQSTNRVAELEIQLKAAFEQRDQKSQHAEGRRGVQTDLQERVASEEKQIKVLRSERDHLGDDMHALEIRVNTIESDIRAIAERIREDYDIDISTISAVRPDSDMPEDQVSEHLAALKERLKKFGAVNLLALEEYKEASEREKFLNEQLTDLDKARTDLNSTIVKINQTARQLFGETLAKVQENFSSLFVELFNGGEASISLIDDDDPLESDIEITARPRGKKLLSITMMSGGERALTAIALLFALYLVKPSPFCILDEIDAPLDDANCHRFLRIIRKFSAQTQFVTITHNKITMEAADNLYGITMEQPGISKLVAVRFLEGDGDTTAQLDSEPAPAEPELPESVRERIEPDIAMIRREDG
jgi:chromosome segregation protein